MELRVSGFNSHKQIKANSEEDVSEFSKTFEARSVQVLCALWSCTILQVDESIIYMGYRCFGRSPCRIKGLAAADISHVFGDDSGLLGVISRDRKLLLPEEDQKDGGVRLIEREVGLRIGHLAILVNGQVCVCTRTSTQRWQYIKCYMQNIAHVHSIRGSEK